MKLLEKAASLLRRADRAALDLLYPRGAVCLNCGRLSGGDALCSACREELDRVRLERQKGPVLSCWAYDGPAGKLVRQLKENGAELAAAVLAEGICQKAAAMGLPEDTVVTWVPMPRRRFLERGRDHGKALAEAVARGLGLQAALLLRRRKGSSGHTQRGLNREQRQRNVRGAFEPAAAELPRQVLLVDDVLTTGATLRACGQALREAGVEEIRMITATAAGRAAHTLPEEDGEAT